MHFRHTGGLRRVSKTDGIPISTKEETDGGATTGISRERRGWRAPGSYGAVDAGKRRGLIRQPWRRDLRFLFDVRRRIHGRHLRHWRASTFDATDIALKIGQTAGDDDSNTVTVNLVGGIPLADLSFDPGLGLNVAPGGAPLIASHTFAISDLSTGLTVEHFNEFAGIPLKPSSLYWIDLTSTSSSADDAFVTWGLTSDVSGVGVAQNYNSSDATDFGFFLNRGVPPFAGDVAFQMEVSGTAVPELSTWVALLLGFAGLGCASYRASRRATMGA
jgi:hypothetical protein